MTLVERMTDAPRDHANCELTTQTFAAEVATIIRENMAALLALANPNAEQISASGEPTDL